MVVDNNRLFPLIERLIAAGFRRSDESVVADAISEYSAAQDASEDAPARLAPCCYSDCAHARCADTAVPPHCGASRVDSVNLPSSKAE